MTSQSHGDLSSTLAANVRQAREESGLSQREFAAKLDTDAGVVSKWERGIHRPSGTKLAALAHITGRTVAWFYEDHSTKAAA